MGERMLHPSSVDEVVVSVRLPHQSWLEQVLTAVQTVVQNLLHKQCPGCCITCYHSTLDQPFVSLGRPGNSPVPSSSGSIWGGAVAAMSAAQQPSQPHASPEVRTHTCRRLAAPMPTMPVVSDLLAPKRILVSPDPALACSAEQQAMHAPSTDAFNCSVARQAPAMIFLNAKLGQ